MPLENAPTLTRPVNWRVGQFCEAHGLGRTRFYELVNAGELKLIKCGRTTLIPDNEARRFQASLEAGRIAHIQPAI